MQKVAQNGTMFQKLQQYMQLALTFAQAMRPDMAEMIAQDIMQTMGGMGGPMGGASAQLFQSDNIAGIGKKEPAQVENARSRASEVSQPNGGKVVAKKEGKEK